jgi:hypothetical protein
MAIDSGGSILIFGEAVSGERRADHILYLAGTVIKHLPKPALAGIYNGDYLLLRYHSGFIIRIKRVTLETPS